MMTLLLAEILSQAQVAAPAQRAPAQPAPAAPALTIGSKAPLPEISDFIRGDKPTFFEPGKVYVLEFWATWCGPCRQGMPHLTKVAEEMKPKGVVVVGISDEKPDTVRSFLEKDEWKQKARYILATDPDRSTQRDYMEAAGQNGIPTAFIVKEGVVQWIGHPMEMDEPLAKIVAGTWDPKAAKQGFEDEAAEQMKVMAKQNAITTDFFAAGFAAGFFTGLTAALATGLVAAFAAWATALTAGVLAIFSAMILSSRKLKIG